MLNDGLLNRDRGFLAEDRPEPGDGDIAEVLHLIGEHGDGFVKQELFAVDAKIQALRPARVDLGGLNFICFFL